MTLFTFNSNVYMIYKPGFGKTLRLFSVFGFPSDILLSNLKETIKMQLYFVPCDMILNHGTILNHAADIHFLY